MTRINTGKVVAGGLLAGLLFNIGDFLINGYLLTAEYQATLTRLGLDAAAMESVGAMVCWVVIDFVFGLLIVWNYAGIRPRFGPGPLTALLAALPLYAGATLIVFGFASMGIFTTAIATKGAIYSAVNTAIGSIAGAWLYSEA